MCRRTEEEVVPTVGLPMPWDISQGSLTCPSYTDTEPSFLYGDSDTPPHSVAFYDTMGIRRTYSRLKSPASSRGSDILSRAFQNTNSLEYRTFIKCYFQLQTCQTIIIIWTGTASTCPVGLPSRRKFVPVYRQFLHDNVSRTYLSVESWIINLFSQKIMVIPVYTHRYLILLHWPHLSS